MGLRKGVFNVPVEELEKEDTRKPEDIIAEGERLIAKSNDPNIDHRTGWKKDDKVKEGGVVGQRRIKFIISEENYQYIKKEAERTGLTISAMTTVLVDEAIQERKLYIERVLKAV
jgi:hypothetical protein